MRAARASGGHDGRILRIRSPSLMCEMRTGGILAGGAATGKTGREPLLNRLGMPRGSPVLSPVVDEPNPVICGGPSSVVVLTPFGIRVGVRRVRSRALLRGAVLAPARVLAAGGFPGG